MSRLKFPSHIFIVGHHWQPLRIMQHLLIREYHLQLSKSTILLSVPIQSKFVEILHHSDLRRQVLFHVVVFYLRVY